MANKTKRPAPALSDVPCAWCGKLLEHETFMADASREPDLQVPAMTGDQADAHALRHGRTLVRLLKNHAGEVWAYTYITPDLRPGYGRNGVFCRLRCGFRFGLAAHRAGYRVAVANGKGDGA